MKKRSDKVQRVVIAVTESSPLPDLWRVALQTLRDSRAEIMALFLHDERWQRAASLPFTREISKVGGEADFTLQRADQLLAETITRFQKEIEQLASEADLEIEFRVLPESDQTQAQALIGQGGIVFIAPSQLAEHPIVVELTRLDLRIEFVDV